MVTIFVVLIGAAIGSKSTVRYGIIKETMKKKNAR